MSCRTKKPTLTLSSLVDWAKASTTLSASALAKHPGKVWMDSRKIQDGDLFVAVAGESDDGHNHVHAAFSAGACAAIVARKNIGLYTGVDAGKLIIVRDPLTALQTMAKNYRLALNMPLIAVTGSNGKTTTCRFLNSVLSVALTVGATKGNFNNHLGVPLSILSLSGKEDLAILEFGANHIGEISQLSRMASPDHVVITNIGFAHVGEFGGIENTSKAKFEIVTGMPKKGGLLIVNGDDARCVKYAKASGRDVVLFGLSKNCTYRAMNVKVEANATTFTVNDVEYRLNMPGRHFVLSVLPAILEATIMGVDSENIVEAVSLLEPDPLRGRIETKAGIRFIVDCYNANPSSMQTALEFLGDVTADTYRCAIIGDMRELGRYSKSQHRLLGKKIGNAGVRKLILVGDSAALAAQSAIAAGLGADKVICVASADEALDAAKKLFKIGDTVLLKGSRAMALETIFNKFGNGKGQK